MANENQYCIPWNKDNYYLINGTKYAYETNAGLDFIWLYDGMGKMYVEDVKAQGYQVTKPKIAYTASHTRTKMPSAGSASYYKNKVLEAA